MRFLPKEQPYLLGPGRPFSAPGGLPHDRDTNRWFGDVYRAAVAYTDDRLRDLFTSLAQRGLTFENTLFVVTADHGEEFFDAHPEDPGGTSHGRTLFEEQLHVPLLVRLPPGLPRPLLRTEGRIAQPVSLVDVMPTLLDLLGIRVAGKRLDGTSLRGAVDTVEQRVVFSGGSRGRVVVRDGRYKLYRFDRRGHLNRALNFLRPAGEGASEPVEHLFDLDEDPGERHDIRDRLPTVATRLRAVAGQYVLRRKGRSVALDEETRNQLKSLGYIE
jgi:arylsulfatase A-like enzyme